MAIMGIPKTDWVNALSGVLTGKAMDAFSKLTLTTLADYELVKAALLDRYQIGADHFRKQFREIKRLGKESFSETGEKLRNACIKWLECRKAMEDPKLML